MSKSSFFFCFVDPVTWPIKRPDKRSWSAPHRFRSKNQDWPVHRERGIASASMFCSIVLRYCIFPSTPNILMNQDNSNEVVNWTAISLTTFHLIVAFHVLVNWHLGTTDNETSKKKKRTTNRKNKSEDKESTMCKFGSYGKLWGNGIYSSPFYFSALVSPFFLEHIPHQRCSFVLVSVRLCI